MCCVTACGLIVAGVLNKDNSVLTQRLDLYNGQLGPHSVKVGSMKKFGAVFSFLFLLTSCANSDKVLEGLEQVAGQIAGDSGELSLNEITSGLKEALSIGSEQVVQQLGRNDGFNADPIAHIPLPKALDRARDVAAKVGLADGFDSLETQLNRAAEIATPKAKSLFIGAIRQMSLEDAKGILNGPDDSATQYFRGAMGQQLAAEMKPIVDDSLGQVGAVRAFNNLLGQYRQIPFAPPVEADLTDHVVTLGMDGIFHYIAEEEKAIRNDPVRRTTELLKRVFGAG